MSVVDIDPRFTRANQLAADIRAKAEELSTAIYQAEKDGYRASLRICNGIAIDDVGGFIGNDEGPLVVKATIAFDIGRAVL